MNKPEISIKVLRYVLGVVVLAQSIMVAAFYQEVAKSSHIPFPAEIVLGLAVVEAIGALLLLLPWTLKIGGWILLAVFFVAVVIHFLHGQFEGMGMIIYAAAVVAVMYNTPKK